MTLRLRSFELFGNLLPKGESDIDLRASSESAFGFFICFLFEILQFVVGS